MINIAGGNRAIVITKKQYQFFSFDLNKSNANKAKEKNDKPIGILTRTGFIKKLGSSATNIDDGTKKT